MRQILSVCVCLVSFHDFASIALRRHTGDALAYGQISWCVIALQPSGKGLEIRNADMTNYCPVLRSFHQSPDWRSPRRCKQTRKR